MGRRRPENSWDESGKRRTIASAVFPAPGATARPPARAYPQDAAYEDYEEAARDVELDDPQVGSLPFAPLLTLPTLPAVQAPPARRAPLGLRWGRPKPPATPAPPATNSADADWAWSDGGNERDEDAANWAAPPSPSASFPRMRAAPGDGRAASSPHAPDASGARQQPRRWGQPASPGRMTATGPQSAPPGRLTTTGPQSRLGPIDPDALPMLMPQAGAAQRAANSAPLAPRRPNRSRALATLDVVLVPGRNLTRRLIPRALRHHLARPTLRTLEFIQRRRVVLIALLVIVLATGLVANVTGLGREAITLSANAWSASGGVKPLPTPLIAPDTLDAGHYVAKYGFDYPAYAQALPSDEWNRLVTMLPYAIIGANAADRKYNATIEPEMIVWWTHAEGIGGRINYSNCANQGTRPGTNYFSDIENCNHSSFWQLGYGNQFSVIYVLKDAFTALYGDPNNTKAVQKVGQGVLNFDASQGTQPACGGYSCTFPAMTIDQIVAGINEDTGMVTTDNWWASVLSRDPAINSYMIAYALTFFNHAATRNWIGCYYYEPCWGYESDKLGDILAAWPGLRKAAHM